MTRGAAGRAPLRPRTIRDVAESQLCTGCGACAYVTSGAYRMVEDDRFGRRPLAAGDAPSAAAEAEALAACPGHALEHTFDVRDPALDRALMRSWGPVRAVHEGHAADPEIRRAGSSGGAATALSLFCLERLGMHGVLHTAARRDRPYLNETVLSTSREELMAATGSRYSPASPCDGLDRIEAAPGPCAFVGKPCDAAAVQSARRLRPRLDERLGVVVAFFCAGTPSLGGTLELLRRAGVEDPDSVLELRYRGNGWPGRWTVRWRDAGGEVRESSLTYEESWGALQRHRQWRCYVCPDHTGEFADLALGDPWYRPISPGEPGSSLIVVRTERGERVLREAVEAGYLVLERTDASLLPRSQPNLLGTRGGLWGRLMALRLARAPRPRLAGFPTFPDWLSALSLKGRAQSVVGTLRRVGRKGLRRRFPVREWSPGAPARRPELAPTGTKDAGKPG